MVEYSRMHKRINANTEVAAQTARIGSAKVTGLMKLGTTPEGGAMDRVMSRGTPGGSETAILGFEI